MLERYNSLTSVTYAHIRNTSPGIRMNVSLFKDLKDGMDHGALWDLALENTSTYPQDPNCFSSDLWILARRPDAIKVMVGIFDICPAKWRSEEDINIFNSTRSIGTNLE